MRSHQNWANSLGFRQLIEDGLAILRDEPVSAQRRAYVLGDLREIILQAKQGSDLVRNSALSVTSADRSAYESFSLLDRFLFDAESEYWRDILGKTESALTELSKQEPRLIEEQRSAAIVLLDKVLSGISREPRPGIPPRPEEWWVGG